MVWCGTGSGERGEVEGHRGRASGRIHQELEGQNTGGAGLVAVT